MVHKYTKTEIIKMANDSYNRCNGCVRCEHFRPVPCDHKNIQNNVDKLFKCSDTGCFYAAELPWNDTKWCWFFPPKIQTHVDRLWALSIENLVDNLKTKSR